MTSDLRAIEQAYKKYGPGSEKAVRNMAKHANLNEKAAVDWWKLNGNKKDAVKGKALKQTRNLGTPIFSQRPGGWQFDTVCPKGDGPYYLWFTNVNTKETRAYEMKDKSSNSVKDAMEKFLVDTKNNSNPKRRRDVYSLTSDQDPAYATPELIEFYKDNDIRYRTTTKNSKHVLGIVNRNIRMIRDRIANTEGLVDENGKKGITGNMPRKEVDLKISGWNTEKNDNMGGHSPYELSSKENRALELDYIANKMNQADARREEAFKDLHEGQYVRRFKIGPKQHAEKNLDPYTWKVHSIDKLRGKVYLGREDKKEGLVAVPRCQIQTGEEYLRGRVQKPEIDLLNREPTRIIDKFFQNGKDKYTVEYEDGSTKNMSVQKLRGSNPMMPHKIEDEFNKTHAPPESTSTMATRKNRKQVIRD